MAIFTTSIRLHDATENDYNTLHAELENQARKRRQNLAISNGLVNGESNYNWDGNVTIQKIAESIINAAPKTGKKYSFSIVRNQ
jgi:hypothetical protein